jgi:hypothetical protein
VTDIFGRDRKVEQEATAKNLQTKIGQLSMEDDFLSVVLGCMDKPSAKR